MDRDPQAPWRAWLAAAGLVLLAGAVYARALGNGFVGIDTGTYLTANPHVLAGLSWSGARWAFTSFHGANWHPLTWLSHMLDAQMFGVVPAGHHAVSIAFHAANSVLAFLLLRAWTGRSGASFAVAALFAVHPLHVESVAWMVERKDVLSAFFGLASLLAWTKWARARSVAAYVGALCLFAAALMSKPMLVTLPFVMLVADVWPLRRAERWSSLWTPLWNRLVLEKLPFFALSAAACVVTVRAQSHGGALQSLSLLPLAARIGNAIAAYGWYALKAVWPTGLSFHYPLATAGAGAVGIAWGAAVLVVVGAVAYAQRERRAWILSGWLMFAGMLVPVIGIVQVGGQAHADRYAYLPLLGIMIAAVWSVADVVRNGAVARALACGCAAIFAVMTVVQVGTWKNSETLARHALDVDPRNAVAHDVLGVTLVDQGRVSEGLAHLQTAVELQPGDPDARFNFGRALRAAGKLGAAERELRQAAMLRPDHAPTLANLGATVAARGDFTEGLALLDRATRADPDDAGVRLEYGEALLQAGKSTQAEHELRAALALAPGSLRLEVDLARVLIQTSRGGEAEPVLRAVLAADAHNPQALQQLALVQAGRGDLADAVASLRAALATQPGWTLAMADLAWILATAPDPKLRAPAEALALARGAMNPGTRDQPAFLDVLAAALAANGEFDRAAATAGEAAQRARQSGDVALAERIERRKSAYAAHTIDTAVPR